MQGGVVEKKGSGSKPTVIGLHVSSRRKSERHPFLTVVCSHVQGGVVEKKREWKQAERLWLLAVEDPQQLGKDIGSGSYNIRNVRQLFAAAASTLRDCPHHQTEQDQWAAVQVC